MKNILSYLKKESILFLLGGILYFFIEILYRGYSHWTMCIVGGLCFVLMGLINELFTFDMYIEIQAIISSIIITILEFISGYLINIVLKWNVWDYSNMPFNIMGQVCLLFTFMWFFLSFVGIVVDDYIRYIAFDEEKPKYKSYVLLKIKTYCELKRLNSKLK